MGDFTDRDLEKVVVVVRNLDGTFSLPTPGGGTGSDVNVTNAQIPVVIKDAGGDTASVTASGYLEVRIAESAAGAGGLTDTELRASPLSVTGPLTDTQLRASALPVSLSGSVAVTGPLTDTQLRATAVPVSGPLTDTQLRAAAVPISDNGGSLTVDGTVSVGNFPATQPVSGTFWQAVQPVNDNGGSLTVDGTFWQATQPVSGPLTDTQLRAAAVHVIVDSGGGGGVEYTEGDTDTTITGKAILWEDAADTLRAVSSTKPLPVAQQGTVTVSGPLTDAQLRATAVPVSFSGQSVSVSNFPATYPVTDNGGSLTVDGTVAVSGTVPVDSELTTQDYDSGAGTATTAVSGLVVPASGGPVAIPGDATNGLDVDVTRVQGSVAVTGTFWQATQPVSGPLTDTQLRATAVPVSGTFWQATQPVSGPLTDTQLRASAVPVSIAATVATREATNATSSVTQVASSATNVTLKASNANRRGLSIHNDSTAVLFLKLGATASSTSYTIKMAAGSHYEVPFSYTGTVDGIWAAANGNAYVTEIT